MSKFGGILKVGDLANQCDLGENMKQMLEQKDFSKSLQDAGRKL